MKRLSILIWLAVFTAVVPLLALPLWLMKPLIIALALSVAALGYSVFRERGYGEVEVGSSAKQSPHRYTAAEDSDEEEEPADNNPQKDPVDITDPDTDRFVATNTYERRRNLNTDNA